MTSTFLTHVSIAVSCGSTAHSFRVCVLQTNIPLATEPEIARDMRFIHWADTATLHTVGVAPIPKALTLEQEVAY